MHCFATRLPIQLHDPVWDRAVRGCAKESDDLFAERAGCFGKDRHAYRRDHLVDDRGGGAEAEGWWGPSEAIGALWPTHPRDAKSWGPTKSWENQLKPLLQHSTVSWWWWCVGGGWGGGRRVKRRVAVCTSSIRSHARCPDDRTVAARTRVTRRSSGTQAQFVRLRARDAAKSMTRGHAHATADHSSIRNAAVRRQSGSSFESF